MAVEVHVGFALPPKLVLAGTSLVLVLISDGPTPNILVGEKMEFGDVDTVDRVGAQVAQGLIPTLDNTTRQNRRFGHLASVELA